LCSKLREHESWTAIVRSTQTGDKIERKRKVGVCLHKEKMKWVEPMEDFLFYFGRECSESLSLSDFFCGGSASQDLEQMIMRRKREARAKGRQERQARQGFDDSVDNDSVVISGQQSSWEATLAPNQKLHLSLFREHGFDPQRIWDLDHNPIKRPRTSRKSGVIQTLTSHGTLWCEELLRPLSALETVMAHAIPVWPHLCGGQESPVDWEKLVANGSLPPLKLKQMVGKGWHVQAMGSFIMFLLSSVEVIGPVNLQHPPEYFWEPFEPWDSKDTQTSSDEDTQEKDKSHPWTKLAAEMDVEGSDESP
jgi:hypothetical protein